MPWNNTPPPTYARVNPLRTDASRLKERWTTENVKFEPCNWDWAEDGLVFRLEAHPPFATLGSFTDGLFYIQDPSTLLAVRELNPKPGETVLDLCAAPGGKTTFIAQLMQNRGRILARDIQPGRLELVRENCARLGATCVHTEDSSGGQYWWTRLVPTPASCAAAWTCAGVSSLAKSSGCASSSWNSCGRRRWN
jgi:16S rRNA (cytosine967-C5)-methyltransferase